MDEHATFQSCNEHLDSSAQYFHPQCCSFSSTFVASFAISLTVSSCYAECFRACTAWKAQTIKSVSTLMLMGFGHRLKNISYGPLCGYVADVTFHLSSLEHVEYQGNFKSRGWTPVIAKM